MAPINTISRSVKIGLNYAATWPDGSFLIVRKFVWTVLFSVLHWHQYSYMVAHFKSDTLFEIVDNVSTCLSFTVVGIKIIVAWTHHSLFRKIITTMEEECKKYAVLDTNNLISKTALMSYRLTTAVIFVYMVAAMCYAIGAITQQSVSTKSRGLLLKMDLPFETSKWFTYGLVIIVQYFFQTSSAVIFGLFSALVLMIVLHVGCQIDIMCQTLIKAPFSNEMKLKFFISRHQEIIIFSERIEQFFTYIALSQLISNTLITCGLGYIIVITLNVSNGSSMLIKCVMFYISICLEAFIYSFAGEYLSTKSKLITDTAYEFLWYNIHPNKSRLLIPVILRSQKGFTFTYGKFAKLSMESYTSMMKASASYISVLLAMS